MKKIITTLCALVLLTNVQAQTPTTVSMGAGYGNNVWYSFANGNVGSASATNWDLALAASISPSSPITTSVLFNPKSGTLFVAPDSFTPVDDFSDLDTAGMANTWTKLYNDDLSWAGGAFSQPATGYPDYGWGTYDGVSHTGIAARRIYVIRYGNGSSVPYTYKKLHIALAFSGGGTYTITYDKLDNSDAHTGTIAVPSYSTKDFAYYSLTNNAAIDREPVNTTWDVLFTQYISTSELYKSNPTAPTPGAANQLVGGVLLNRTVKAAQANNVTDRTTYTNYSSETFSSDANIIGWDWKYLNASFAWEVVSDTVYFVKLSNDDVYALYFTSFGGSSTGNFNFTQQKVSTVTGIFSPSEKASLSVYPNPSAHGNATVIYDFSSNGNAELSVTDLSGNVLYTENISSASGLNTYTFSTAALKNGLYIVSLKTNSGLLQQKLAVK